LTKISHKQVFAMAKRTLRALSFLAPNMLPIYRFLLDYLGIKLGCEITLTAGSNYDEVFHTDLSFICGLPYVLYTSPHLSTSPVEALVAPVLQGERFQNRPIYYSDVIVHRDSPFQCFADLRGCSWAYNEPLSQSGYGITRYSLLKMGETKGYFGKLIQAGFHQKAIRMVCQRQVDASAIDVQVLAVEMQKHPSLSEKLRIMTSLGPSTIQPLAASKRLPASLKEEIQAVFSEIHQDEAVQVYLEKGFIDHFVRVSDGDYDDIRMMLKTCTEADFLILR
jgi:phosphonate transport system substrate-binding protein